MTSPFIRPTHVSRLVLWAAAALLVLVLAGTLTRRAQAGSTAPGRKTVPSWLAGGVLPDVPLTDLRRRPVGLRQALGGQPAILYLVGRETCLDCTQLPLEMRIVRREHPGLRQWFIAVGSDTAFFARYARTQRIAPQTLLDPGQAIPRALGTPSPDPLILIVDGTGRILYVDARGGAAFSRFPISSVLRAMSAALTAAPARTPDAGPR